jgi:DNA primase
MSVTQQIKDRLDIVQYIQEYVPDLKKAGRYYKACCPFHGEKTPSFVVNPDTQSWRCFGACAEGGDIFTFAQKRNGWTFAETLQSLGERAGIQVEKRTPEEDARDQYLERLRGMLETAADWYYQHLISDDPQAQQVMDYAVQKRGLLPETIEHFRIGYAPPGWSNMLDALKNIGYSEEDVMEAGLASRNDRGRIYDRFRNRLIIPICDERGHVIGFGARALDPDDSPKYLNSPQSALFDKSATLFALNHAKGVIRDSGTAVIVEGYMDAIQAHQAGYKNVIAQMGTAMTETQLKLLVPRYARKIILALDADQAGQNATRRSLEVARQTLQADYVGKLSVDLRVLQIDGAKDPDDVLRETPEKWAEYVENAIAVADFVIDMETAHLSQKSSIQERQQAAQNILPILTASENNIYTQDNLQKLALRVRIPESDLLAWAEELRRREQATRKARPQQPATPPAQAAPQFPDESSHDSSEEPPPFFDYDTVDAPPPDDEFVIPSVPIARSKPERQKPGLASRSISRQVEGFCLRMLLKDPALLPQINRRLRELAGDNPQLAKGPLREFSAEDFSQGDFRTILASLQAALRQDDAEPLDYLRGALEPALLHDLEQMLRDEEDHVQHSINGKYESDLKAIWTKVIENNPIQSGMNNEPIKRALQVRHQRLERENHEIRFLLEEAQRSADTEAQHLYFAQTLPTTRALDILGRELKDKLRAR